MYKMENKPFKSILNYLKDKDMISKKEFDYLNNDEAAAKNTILYYYDSLPINEIMKILNLSESAVKKRLERARNMLRKEMEE